MCGNPRLQSALWAGRMAIAWAVLSSPIRAEEATVSLKSLLAAMTDIEAIARWPQPEYTCRQVSSYDRQSKSPKDPAGWFANTDNMDGLGTDLRWETVQGRRECVLAEVEGPGAIVRFWSGGNPPKGRVRFYLDGAAEPAIEGALQELFSGKGFVPRPLAIENAGAAVNCYLPVPYALRCKITYDEADPVKPGGPPPGRWYNVEYRTYAPGTKVETFSIAAFRAARPEVERVVGLLLDPPCPAFSTPIVAGSEIEPGKGASLELPRGPQRVYLLHMRLVETPKEQIDQALRSTVLRAEFDGEPTIWCPLGDFFGSGVGLNALDSWYRAIDKNGTMTCRWVMPYRESASISLLNLVTKKVRVEWGAAAAPWRWDDRSMHFHANWHQQTSIPTRPMIDWNYITVTGRGVYAGDSLAVMNPVASWWGEGDEKFWVDGEPFPSHFGTGSGDYYGYAWGHPAVFQGPFCNQPRAGAGNRGHTTNTRTRSLDAIPFRESLKTDIEIWHWAECKVAYGVATYWYAIPGAGCNRGPAAAEAAAAIPQPPAPAPATISGAIECESMPVVARSPDLQWMRQERVAFPHGSWSGDVQILYLGTKPRDFVELQMAEKLTGARRVILYATKSYDYGILRFSVNGRAVPKEFDAYSDASVLSGPIDLGVFEPKDGRFVLRVEVAGSNPKSQAPGHYFGLDAAVLTPP